MPNLHRDKKSRGENPGRDREILLDHRQDGNVASLGGIGNLARRGSSPVSEIQTKQNTQTAPPASVKVFNLLFRCSNSLFDPIFKEMDQIQPRVWRISGLTQNGTAEAVSGEQSLRRERGEGETHFSCSANHTRVIQPPLGRHC